MKIFKKCDFILIIFLIILSFVPYFIFVDYVNKNYSSIYAEIKVDGEIYKTIPLSSHKGKESFTINTKQGTNKIIIENNSISMFDADCSDLICIKQGIISKVGQNLICLPHKLVIEIKGEESDNSDDLILSH